MAKKKKEPKPQGLSDEELIKKYETLIVPPTDFSAIVRGMVNEPNPAIYKAEKRVVTHKENSKSKIEKP